MKKEGREGEEMELESEEQRRNTHHTHAPTLPHIHSLWKTGCRVGAREGEQAENNR